MLAKQLSFWPMPTAPAWSLGARVPIILTSRADSVRSRIASCAVAVLAAHARRRRRCQSVQGDTPMQDPTVVLVLNAGSSSLKFCVYRALGPTRLAAGGARPDRRHRHRAAILGQRCRGIALDELSRSDATVTRRHARRSTRSPPGCATRYGGARVLGVGHRVVHGGAAVRRADGRHARGARGSAGARAARAAPSAAQPRGDRGGGASGCRACRRSPASTPAFIAASRRWPSSCRCRARSAAPACSATASTACRTSTSRRCCRRSAPEIARRPRDRRAPGQRRQPVRDEAAARASTARFGFTALDGLCMGTRPGAHRSRRRPLPVPGAGAVGEGRRDDALQEVRPARHLRASATTCATCSAAASRRARLAVDYFVYRAAKEIGALAAVLGGIDALVFTAGIGENSPEIRERICEASAWLGIELDARPTTQNAVRGSPTAGSRVSAWVIPTNEELMIARHTGALLGLADRHMPPVPSHRNEPQGM